MKLLEISFIFLLTISGCVQEANQNNQLGGVVDEEEEYNELMAEDTTANQSQSENTALEMYTDKYIDLLHQNNLEGLAEYFHPTKGAYFLPYAHFDTSTVINLKKTEFIQTLNANKIFTWGVYDGSGEPITLDITNYFKQFVYNIDFKNLTTSKHINTQLVSSNSLNNIGDILPKAKHIEYHYKGSKQYDGLDWSSLIFYVEEYNGQYYIVALVHNQWTI